MTRPAVRALSVGAAAYLAFAAPVASQSEGGGDLLTAGHIPFTTGYVELQARLAGGEPTGAGVVVAQSEPNTNPGYKPDPNDPEFLGKTFLFLSGPGSPSTHATLAGQHFYGLETSISPGPDQIHCYWAEPFTNDDPLNGTGPTPPNAVPWKVLKNGAHNGTGAFANTMMRKIDFMAAEQDLLLVHGVRNSFAPHTDPMWSHSYNGISVGRSDGKHRHGPTLAGYDGAGRQKPEMVAPQAAVSYSKPLVSGTAAALVETARTHAALAGNPNAERSEVLKAVIMAGAEHRAGWANDAPQSGPSRGIATLPLDVVYGVDEIDIDHAHWILTGGEHDGATTSAAALDARHNGWDLFTLPAGQSRFWRFQVENPKPHFSVVLTWHRIVAPDFQSFELASLDMELFSVDAQGTLVPITGEAGNPYFAGGNVRSESPLDNVEHLYVTGLQPGEYVLEVMRDPDGLQDFDAAVAWELACIEPVAYGTAKTTSSGLIPSLSWSGFPSAAEDDFEITVTDAEPNKNGIFFYGTNGRKAAPFKGGLMLVQGPLKRLPLMTTSGTGTLTVPLPIDAGMIGEQRNYQFWFRDPNAPIPYGLSDALEVFFCP